ncbi:MAG: hypothetical protein M3Y56_05810 [Armatimonadota bacterium]|nr:hypothetical protein [Armatimonadota bacterium]
MTKNTLLDFGAAVHAKDFTRFHSHLAAVTQKHVSPAMLAEHFKVFMDQGIDPTGAIRTLKPVFTPDPVITGKGELVVQGYYPSKPLRLSFKLYYQSEANAWKLSGADLKAKPPQTGVSGKNIAKRQQNTHSAPSRGIL